MMPCSVFIVTAFMAFLALVDKSWALTLGWSTLSCENKTIFVNSLFDSPFGDCSTDSSSCNLRACINLLQGSKGTCLLMAGTHTVATGGGLMISNLNPNTQLTIAGSTGNPNDVIINGNNQPGLIISEEPTATLIITSISMTNFFASTSSSCDQGGGTVVRAASGTSLYIKNCIFSNNRFFQCNSVQIDVCSTSGVSSYGVYDTLFFDNAATTTCDSNNACNKFGALCVFNNIMDRQYCPSGPYDFKNLTFSGNSGCDGGEAIAVHLGNFMGGNAYAGDGMQWYSNGYYSSVPCLTYDCTQPGFHYTFKTIENIPSISCSPTIAPTFVPSAQPTEAPTFIPTFTRTPTASPSKSALDVIRELISVQQVSIDLLNKQMLTNRKSIEKLQGEMVRKTKDIDAIREDVVKLRQIVKRLKSK